MTEFLKKYKYDIVAWVVLVLVFFITRLLNLGLIPIFTDEAIYLRWSQIMAYDAALRYMPLVDGKPPLFMWLVALVMRILPSIDVLLTGRLVAVISGFFALTGIYFASWVLFRNKFISYTAAVLYLLMPITFFYDRFGLPESLLTAIGVWAFGLTALLFKKPRLDVSLILGGLLGIGLLTKTNTIFYLILIPLFILLFDFRSKTWKENLVKLTGSLLIVILLSQMVFSLLRLFPLFHMISQKNSEFVIPLSLFIKEPFGIFESTFTTLLHWEFQYLSIGMTALLIVSIFLGIKNRWRETLLLCGYFLAWFLAMSFFNKVIFPRYLLPLTPVLILILSSGFYFLTIRFKKSKYLVIVLGVLLLLPSIVTDYRLHTNPTAAPIADGDSNQYLNSWPAGYGVSEVRDFLADISKNNSKVTVGTEGTFGLMPYALELYKDRYRNLEIIPFWPLPDKIPDQILSAAKDHPTFFIVYQRQDLPPLWRVKLISEYKQGLGTDKLRLYEITP